MSLKSEDPTIVLEIETNISSQNKEIKMLCYSFITVMLMASLFNSGDAATFTTPGTGTESADVDENAAVGDSVVTIAATQATGGGLGDYILVTQDVPFSLATTGALTVRTATLDFETTPTYELEITVTDTDTVSGTITTATATLTVSVQDINEAPSFAEDTYNVCVLDESAVATTVTTLSAADPDSGATQMYSITVGNTGTDFTISSDKLTVANALSKTRTDTYTLTIEVSDGTNTDTASFVVTVASTCSGASAMVVSLTTLLLGLVYALN